MMRPHRHAHRMIWMLALPAAVVILAAGVYARVHASQALAQPASVNTSTPAAGVRP